MSEDKDDRFLMSDSLQGRLADVEGQIFSAVNSLVIFAMIVACKEVRQVIAGSVVGIVFEKECVKVDMRLSIDQAYSFMIAHDNDPWTCVEYHLQLGDADHIRTGEFLITSPRMVDINHTSNECTLGFDISKMC